MPNNVRPQDALSPNAPPPDALAVFTPTLTKYSTKDFQTMTKVCIDSFFQAQARRLESHKKGQLKAKLPDLYYDKTYMECYHFCQQCENYFATADATGFNHTPFATFFLYSQINFC